MHLAFTGLAYCDTMAGCSGDSRIHHYLYYFCDVEHHNGGTGTLVYMTKQIQCSPGAYKQSTGARLRHSKLLSFAFRLLDKQHTVAINTCSASLISPLSQLSSNGTKLPVLESRNPHEQTSHFEPDASFQFRVLQQPQVDMSCKTLSTMGDQE